MKKIIAWMILGLTMITLLSVFIYLWVQLPEFFFMCVDVVILWLFITLLFWSIDQVSK